MTLFFFFFFLLLHLSFSVFKYLPYYPFFFFPFPFYPFLFCFHSSVKAKGVCMVRWTHHRSTWRVVWLSASVGILSHPPAISTQTPGNPVDTGTTTRPSEGKSTSTRRIRTAEWRKKEWVRSHIHPSRVLFSLPPTGIVFLTPMSMRVPRRNPQKNAQPPHKAPVGVRTEPRSVGWRLQETR